MQQNTSPSLDELKIIYQEIINGYSASSDGVVFYKHFTELDTITILRQKKKFYEQYLQSGIPTEAERLKTLIEGDGWSAQKEDDILSLRLSISDNEKNILTVISQQQPAIRAAIDQDKTKLVKLLISRAEALGTTADELSDRDSRNYAIFLAAYKDADCRTKLWTTWDDMESQDHQELDKRREDYDAVHTQLTEQNIRLVAVLPMFLNIFSYAKDNIKIFLNKPLIELSTFQSHLFSCGQRNLNVLSQAEGHPPDLIGDTTPTTLLNWYDQQYSIILGKRNSSK